MANTLIKPLLFAPLVRQKMLEQIKISALAYHSDLINGTQTGETISFPQWVNGSPAIEINKGDRIPTEELNQTESLATIKQVAIGKRFYDRDVLTALGDFKQEAALQIADAFAQKIDSDLAAEAQTTSLRVASQSATSVTSDEFAQAMTLFGDSQNFDSFAGIMVHSLAAESLYQWTMESSFTDRNNTTITDGNGIVRNNLIGFYRKIPVYISDAGSFDKTKNETITYFIKKDALGLLTKKLANVEESRDAGAKATDLFADIMYAVKLLNPENGVAIIRKTIV